MVAQNAMEYPLQYLMVLYNSSLIHWVHVEEHWGSVRCLHVQRGSGELWTWPEG